MISSHDNVMAALSINKNHKLKVIDGFAKFNITGEFTEREQEKFKEKGYVIQKLLFSRAKFHLEPNVFTHQNNSLTKNSKPTTGI